MAMPEGSPFFLSLLVFLWAPNPLFPPFRKSVGTLFALFLRRRVDRPGREGERSCGSPEDRSRGAPVVLLGETSMKRSLINLVLQTRNQCV